jgi:metal-responsive CopG/Arc/MetJ family transcriptional regulator
MKIAVSIPDQLFKAAERQAKKLKISRSALYARAIEAFLAAQIDRDVTGALNRIYGEEKAKLDPFLAKMQSASIPREDW